MLYMTSDVAILAESYSEVIVSIVAQPVLKIGSALAKKVGWGGGWVSARDAVHMAAALASCRKPWLEHFSPFWQLPWLAVEKPWSALA